MKKLSGLLAILLCLAMMISVAAVSANAADDEDVAGVAADADIADTAADSVIIHVKSEDKVPYIYYWNALPTNKETSYPGVNPVSRVSSPASSPVTQVSGGTETVVSATATPKRQTPTIV